MIPKIVGSIYSDCFFTGQHCLEPLANRRFIDENSPYKNKHNQMCYMDFYKIDTSQHCTTWYFEQLTLIDRKPGVSDVIDKNLWIISLDREKHVAEGLEHLETIDAIIDYQKNFNFDLGLTLLDLYLEMMATFHPFLYNKIIASNCFTGSMAKDLKIVTKNFYKGFKYPDAFEKIISTTTSSVLKKMIRKDSFNLVPAKKVSQIIEIPKQAIDFISQTGMASLMEPFKKINTIDGNTLVLFINYLQYIKKFSPSKQRELSLYRFSNNCSQLLESGYSINPLLRYLTKQQILTQGTLELPLEISTILLDYYNMATEMCCPFERTPQHLEKSHYVLQKNQLINNSPEFRLVFEKKCLELQSMNLKSKEYLFITPKTVSDMVYEGQMLHHCVASFCKRIVRNECYIFFLRKIAEPETPFVTVLVNKDFKVLQAKGLWNEDAGKETQDVISKFCATLKSESRKLVI